MNPSHLPTLMAVALSRLLLRLRSMRTLPIFEMRATCWLTLSDVYSFIYSSYVVLCLFLYTLLTHCICTSVFKIIFLSKLCAHVVHRVFSHRRPLLGRCSSIIATILAIVQKYFQHIVSESVS